MKTKKKKKTNLLMESTGSMKAQDDDMGEAKVSGERRRHKACERQKGKRECDLRRGQEACRR